MLTEVTNRHGKIHLEEPLDKKKEQAVEQQLNLNLRDVVVGCFETL
jgi:hypothetical protein